MYSYRLTDVRWDREECESRTQLAAVYREFAQRGWTKMIFNHITARAVQGSDEFLINPYGLLYEEVCVSNLVKINLQGDALDPADGSVNQAGFIIHSAVHRSRPEVRCVIHHHSPACTAVASLPEGLVPVTLEAAQFFGRTAYYDFTGISEDLEECGRIADALDDKKVLMMRNHGVLVTGESIAEAFYLAVNLELACKTQLAMMQAGKPLITIPVDIAQHTVGQVTNQLARVEPIIEAVVRKWTRLAPEFLD